MIIRLIAAADHLGFDVHIGAVPDGLRRRFLDQDGRRIVIFTGPADSHTIELAHQISYVMTRARQVNYDQDRARFHEQRAESIAVLRWGTDSGGTRAIATTASTSDR